MKMRKQRRITVIKDLVRASVIFTIAILISIFSEDAEPFLIKLPDIVGLVLAGILSSLAIIFGLLSKDDLIEIQKKSLKVNEDLFRDFIDSTKQDVIIIFSTYIFSVIVLIFYNTKIYKYILGLVNFNIFLFLSLGMLMLSLLAVYDVIQSLFTLNNVRNEIAKNSVNNNSINNK